MNSSTQLSRPISATRRSWQRAAAFALLFFLFAGAASSQIFESPDTNIFTVEAAPEMEIFAYGKTVIVRQSAKGVLTFGGDVVVEGRVEGDVAAIGGSVIQKEGAFIGGDVFVLGGKYRAESTAPLRNEGKETVMIAGYEEELREFTQDPSSLFSPAFTISFLAQRLFSVLFWFLVSIGFITIAPGAVSRAATRFRLSTAKILSLGMGLLLVTTIGTVLSVSLLPSYISAIVGLMAFAMVMLAYVFGRVILHVAAGKLIQKYLLADNMRSEALAVFAGVVFWTVLLSVPYVWTLVLVALFAAGIGLVFTARRTVDWQAR